MKRHNRTCMYSATRNVMKRRGTKFNRVNNSNRFSTDGVAIRHGEGTNIPILRDNSDGEISSGNVEEDEYSIADDGSCNITEVGNCIEPDTQRLKHDTIIMAEEILSFIESVDPKHASRFFSLLCDEIFDMTMLRTEMSTLKLCQEVCNRDIDTHLKDKGLRKVEISSTDNSAVGKSYIYLNNILEVISNQISIAGEGDVIFRPNGCSRERISHPMETKPMQSLYSSVREGICGSSDMNLLWNENCTVHTKDGTSFVGFIQIYTDKTAMTLKTNSLVAYPIHVTLLNFAGKFSGYVIDHGHTLVGFLPVGYQKMDSDCNEESDID